MLQEFPEDNKVDDFLNEFRQKISDHNMESLEERKEELKRSKSIFLGIAGGVTLAGIVGWLILAPQYKVETAQEIPVIRRPQTAIRIQPSEPGGMEIPNQDKSIYNIIEKKDDTVVENLLPPPEAPKLPVIAAEEISAPENTGDVLPEAEKIIAQAEAAAQPVVEKAAPAVVQETISAPKEIKTEPEKQDVPAVVQQAKEPEPVKKEEKPVKTVAKTLAPAQNAVKGNWQIQLMSSPNKQAVEKAWNDLSKKYKIQNQPHEIETAVLDGNKTFYRLKTGAFADRGGADALCSSIKTLGGTCIVKKK